MYIWSSIMKVMVQNTKCHYLRRIPLLFLVLDVDTKVMSVQVSACALQKPSSCGVVQSSSPSPQQSYFHYLPYTIHSLLKPTKLSSYFLINAQEPHWLKKPPFHPSIYYHLYKSLFKLILLTLALPLANIDLEEHRHAPLQNLWNHNVTFRAIASCVYIYVVLCSFWEFVCQICVNLNN